MRSGVFQAEGEGIAMCPVSVHQMDVGLNQTMWRGREDGPGYSGASF